MLRFYYWLPTTKKWLKWKCLITFIRFVNSVTSFAFWTFISLILVLAFRSSSSRLQVSCSISFKLYEMHNDVEIRENTRIEPTFSGFLLLCGLCSNASANGIGSRVRKLGLKVLFATNEQYNWTSYSSKLWFPHL